MYAEIERRVAERTVAPQLQSFTNDTELEIPLSQNRSQRATSEARDMSVDMSHSKFNELKDL